MKEYWRGPGVRERRSIQAKIRERKRQLEHLERQGRVDSDPYRHIAGKLEELNEQLKELT
jgi:hypothetical protein